MIKSFMKFKDIVEKVTETAKKEGEPCVYIEDILIEYFTENKLPTYLKKYRTKIKNFIGFLERTRIERIKNQKDSQIDYTEFTEVDGIFYQPMVYDFFQILSSIDMALTMFSMTDEDERLYSIVLISIIFSQNLMLKTGCDEVGIDDEIIDEIRDYMTKSTMENNNQLLKSISAIIGKQKNEEGTMLMPQIRILSSKNMEQDEDYSYLEEYCTNLTEEINKVEWTKLIGRETEIQELQEILLRRDKPNAILVGEPGVGKTKLVQGFTKLIKQNKCNPEFKDYTVYQLNIIDLTAGTSLHGQFEERMSGIISELKEKGKVILYIDEIHQIKNDSERVTDIASMLKPLLTDGKIKIIGSTTEEEYRTSFAKDSALERRFKVLHIKEPTIDETIKIIKGIKPVYEVYHTVKIDSKMVGLIVELADKYLLDKRFPDKAIDLLDAIGAYCKQQGKNNGYKIESDDVYTVVSKLANLPKIKLETSEIERLSKLDETIKEKIVGQDNAIKELVDGVMIAKSGLRERNKTALTLFFKGPSGVGKTETIKQLAEALDIPLYRYDMSEYMEEHTVSKLIGTPPGYVGYENGRAGSGLLINQVKSTPNCIVLLDEIEKANPKVLNVFLQVMDNGKLMSSSGIEADFSNVFLFMTSNVGASESHKMASIGFGADDKQSASEEFFNSSFSPEFRNRLDGAISFNNLTNEVLNKITDNELIELKKVLADKKVKLSYDTSVTKYISGKATKENLGARPIKRIIHNEIKNIISKELVCGKLFKGGKLNITVDKEQLKFKY